MSLGRKKGFAWVYGRVGLDKKKPQRGNSGPLRVLFCEVKSAFPLENILPAFPIHFSSHCSFLALALRLRGCFSPYAGFTLLSV
jgi:hypothetical protein